MKRSTFLGVAVGLAALLCSGCGQYCHRLSFSLEEAQIHLLEASVFEYPPTSVTGYAAEPVCAYQRILTSKRAESIFLELVETAGDAGKVYAMASLTEVSPHRLEAAHASIASRLERKVPIQSGCEVGASSGAQLLEQMRTGGLARELTSAYKGPPW